MKRLVLLSFILVAGMKSFAQIISPGTPTTAISCHVFCFKNTTDCPVSACMNVTVIRDRCEEDGYSYPMSLNKCMTFEPGEEGCIELWPDNHECYSCPAQYSIFICGNNGTPCFSFNGGGGQGVINCGGSLTGISCYPDPRTNVYIIR